jgi:hypothetical protein
MALGDLQAGWHGFARMGGLCWGSVLVDRAFVRAWLVHAAGGGAAAAATNQERGCGHVADAAQDRRATGLTAPKEALAWQARRGGQRRAAGWRYRDDSDRDSRVAWRWHGAASAVHLGEKPREADIWDRVARVNG